MGRRASPTRNPTQRINRLHRRSQETQPQYPPTRPNQTTGGLRHPSAAAREERKRRTRSQGTRRAQFRPPTQTRASIPSLHDPRGQEATEPEHRIRPGPRAQETPNHPHPKPGQATMNRGEPRGGPRRSLYPTRPRTAQAQRAAPLRSQDQDPTPSAGRRRVHGDPPEWPSELHRASETHEWGMSPNPHTPQRGKHHQVKTEPQGNPVNQRRGKPNVCPEASKDPPDGAAGAAFEQQTHPTMQRSLPSPEPVPMRKRPTQTATQDHAAPSARVVQSLPFALTTSAANPPLSQRVGLRQCAEPKPASANGHLPHGEGSQPRGPPTRHRTYECARTRPAPSLTPAIAS